MIEWNDWNKKEMILVLLAFLKRNLFGRPRLISIIIINKKNYKINKSELK